MKKNTLKRTLSVVLSLLMVVGLFSSIPVSAASDDGIIYNDDTGIPDPVLYNYLISEYDINNDGVLQKEEADSIIIISNKRFEIADENFINEVDCFINVVHRFEKVDVCFENRHEKTTH